MKQNQLALHRDTLVKASQLAVAVMKDDDQPDELRAAAADLEFALSEVLLYQSPNMDGQRDIRLVPVCFGMPQYYTEMVSEFLLDLGADVVAEQPVYVLLAKHVAALVDNALYSTDFRLEAYDVLNEILARLTQAAEEMVN